MAFFTYIMANSRNGTLYTGSTDDVFARVWSHKAKIKSGFTAKYSVDKLVWFELHGSRQEAFLRERRIKKWNRAWKLALIERTNPGWRDLYEDANL